MAFNIDACLHPLSKTQTNLSSSSRLSKSLTIIGIYVYAYRYKFVHACIHAYMHTCTHTIGIWAYLQNHSSSWLICRHIMVTPKTWKLGINETLSITIYNTTTYSSHSIQAILYKRQCKCVTQFTFRWWSWWTCRAADVYTVFSHTELQTVTGVHQY